MLSFRFPQFFVASIVGYKPTLSLCLLCNLQEASPRAPSNAFSKLELNSRIDRKGYQGLNDSENHRQETIGRLISQRLSFAGHSL